MDIPEPVKKYWPWALGGVVGLLLIMKMRGGSSAPSDGSANYAALVAAQQAQGTASAQLGLQAQNMQNQTQIAMAKIAGDTALATTQANTAVSLGGFQRDAALAQTSALITDSNNKAQVNYLIAQAQLANAAGGAVSAVLGQLQAPTIASINASSAINQAAIAAAAKTASASYASVGLTNASMQAGSSDVARAIVSNPSVGADVAISSIGNMTGQALAGASAAAAQTAQAISSGNASNSGSMWGAIGTVATYAIMAA